IELGSVDGTRYHCGKRDPEHVVHRHSIVLPPSILCMKPSPTIQLRYGSIISECARLTKAVWYHTTHHVATLISLAELRRYRHFERWKHIAQRFQRDTLDNLDEK